MAAMRSKIVTLARTTGIHDHDGRAIRGELDRRRLQFFVRRDLLNDHVLGDPHLLDLTIALLAGHDDFLPRANIVPALWRRPNISRTVEVVRDNGCHGIHFDGWHRWFGHIRFHVFNRCGIVTKSAAVETVVEAH